MPRFGCAMPRFAAMNSVCELNNNKPAELVGKQSKCCCFGTSYKTLCVTFLSILIVSGCILETEAKVFSRCQLAKELLKQGFGRTFITNWVCLIESESDKNTTKVVKKSNGSSSYGLFQINSKKWCKEGSKKGGSCNVACDSLIDDDITDDSICASKIFEMEGFKYWTGWMKRCKNSNRLPDISNCPDLESVRKSPDRVRKSTFNNPFMPVLPVG